MIGGTPIKEFIKDLERRDYIRIDSDIIPTG